LTVRPAASTTYRVTAYGSGGSKATGAVHLTVIPPAADLIDYTRYNGDLALRRAGLIGKQDLHGLAAAGDEVLDFVNHTQARSAQPRNNFLIPDPLPRLKSHRFLG
jgi:hypothetical protein